MTVIYGLRAPDDSAIRYVGSTNQPEARLKRHIYDAKRGFHYPVCQWIRDLIDKNQSPVMVILDADATEYRNAKEAAWIGEMGKVRPLLNVMVRKKQGTILDLARLEQYITGHKMWLAECQASVSERRSARPLSYYYKPDEKLN